MKCAAAILILTMTPPAASGPGAPPLILPDVASVPTPVAPSLRPSQEWLGEPVLPSMFLFSGTLLEELEGVDADGEAPGFSFDCPPLLILCSASSQEIPTRPVDSSEAESSFPKGITASDIQAWREKDDLRRIREWTGTALFGAPLVVPQVLLEAALPRGLAVGPTTFLYRTSPASSSLAFVVLDQVLFHEAEFLARAQTLADDGVYTEDLKRSQHRVLRQSFMSGFRATYAMPGLTMDLILQTAADQGVAGYLLAPPIGGALFYLKGVDQKVQIGDDIKARFKVASGQQWVQGTRSTEGVPAFSFELRFCDFPVGIVGSLDVSSHGIVPAFIGLGTSLDAVEDVLGLENPASSRRLDLR